jgi:hypothetical protein
LAIFGTSVAESGGRKIWAPDTLTATHLQMPLEWMGYEVRYHDIKSPLPTLPLDESYAAVIVDGALKVPYGIAARKPSPSGWPGYPTAG